MFGRKKSDRYDAKNVEDRLPKGKDERKSVDWMDYDKPNGGPTRSGVNLGKQELESRPGPSDAGIDAPDEE